MEREIKRIAESILSFVNLRFIERNALIQRISKELGLLMEEKQKLLWTAISERKPEDGKLYDIIIWWRSGEQEKRERYIYIEKSFPEWKSMFQQIDCYTAGLYEERFYIEENLITDYKEHIPLPKKPNNL